MQDVIERRGLGERDGFELVAYKVHDWDADVEEFDCYGSEDVAAWKNNEWSFVGVVVKASKEGIDLAEAGIWGFEDGYSPGFGSDDPASGWVDAFDTSLGGDESSYDIPGEAIKEAKATLARLQAGTTPGHVLVPHELAIMAVRACDDAAYRFECEADEARTDDDRRDHQRRHREYKEAQAALERALWGGEQH